MNTYVIFILFFIFIQKSETLALYRISYMWYTAFGALTTMIVASLGTFVTGTNDIRLIDQKLVAPCIRKYIQVKEVKKHPRKHHIEQRNNAIPEVDEESYENEKESAL